MIDRDERSPLARRRAAMLAALIGDMHRLHRARRARRRGLGAALLLAAAAAVAIDVERSAPRGAETIVRAPESVAPPAPAPAPTLAIAIVHTRADVLARYAPRAPMLRTEVIDDDALLDELAAIGRPTGLIRAAGSVRLTARIADPVEAPPGSTR